MSERKGTKALELWCKRLVRDCPNARIENMTTSWRNGIAFCALVHHFRPDLIDITSLKPENIYENNQLAFSVAEKHLGIPALLDPEDMVENEVPDRLSILTYLSQFYQRLGHTVNLKALDTDTKTNEISPGISPTSTSLNAPIKFGKTGLDKCVACGLPVYLAQRLIILHKLYHRRCFRCSKCAGNLNSSNPHIVENDFLCDSCKNETSTLLVNNNDQMGMLAFSDTNNEISPGAISEVSIKPQYKARPQSILERINMFEKNNDKYVEDKLSQLTIKEKINHTQTNVHNMDKSDNNLSIANVEEIQPNDKTDKNVNNVSTDSLLNESLPEKSYKSNIDQYNFLQTQLSPDGIDKINSHIQITATETKQDEIVKDENESPITESITECKDDKNVTDDVRIAKNNNSSITEADPLEKENLAINESEINVSVPPRRKKITTPENKPNNVSTDVSTNKTLSTDYPDDLNPFSDDDEEYGGEDMHKRESTNPFGSSDEENDAVPPIQSLSKFASSTNTTPVRWLIPALNPFWSDGEEPSSDEESCTGRLMHKSPITASTPNLPSARRKKPKAPPPPIIKIEQMDQPANSMDDVASISSLSSHNSTVNSDQKSLGKLTPKSKKKRSAPTPPDSMSTISGYGGSMEKDVDTTGSRSLDSGRKLKGPAPGLPLPERREVKLQMTPEELQVQLDLLETQQLGLERQGVLIEQMIRDKCEGDEPSLVPQEEVEDLVIQLCELVNEKNDLFRKQTELMYIRRQQRLEQEQADIEHEIRVIQSRPAVNRIDADKVREEELVARLVEIVRMRDELVQQIDAERRRERQEDIAIATSIANKRAQRNSESNSSSIKSADINTTPKKNKMKDKVKKQLKKAKHTLVNKRKEDDKPGKEKKVKSGISDK